MRYVIILLLLSLAAVFSGLNLGLMSLGPHELKRKMDLGDKNAQKIYPVRKKGNLLLVTLLVGNVAVNSTLAIFLGSITVGILAVILSTALITIVGEIVPQAFFSRHALTFGTKMVWLVKIFLFVLYPVCAPIAWALDKTLGEELPDIYSRRELVEIIREHSARETNVIKRDEEKIATGALTFGELAIKSAMTPRIAVKNLLAEQPLTKKTVQDLLRHGYTRYPVLEMEKERVVGILYIKDLLDKNLTSKTVGELCQRKVYYFHEDDNLDTALNAFLKTRHHLFIVINEFSDYVGILSIEDVLEEILGREIVDEFDEHTDLRKVARRASNKFQRSIS